MPNARMPNAEMHMPLFFWYVPDLIDPASRPRPWAVWDGANLHWCAGEGDPAKAPSLFEAETITSLPAFIAHGVRFNQTGMAQGNLYEGPMFALDKNKRAVLVGDAVRVASRHTVVREIRVEAAKRSLRATGPTPHLLSVLSDNGDPECDDMKRNGATFISWDPAYRVVRLDNAPRPGMRAADRQDLAAALGLEGEPPAWDVLVAQVRALVPAPAPAVPAAPADFWWGRIRGSSVAHLWCEPGEGRVLRKCVPWWRDKREAVVAPTAKSRYCSACVALATGAPAPSEPAS